MVLEGKTWINVICFIVELKPKVFNLRKIKSNKKPWLFQFLVSCFELRELLSVILTLKSARLDEKAKDGCY